MKGLFRTILLVLAALTLCAPASADWLSLKDGNLIETRGAWREKGKAIVCTSTAGALLSVRLSEVDLAMSKSLGARMAKAKYIDPGESVDPTDKREAHELGDERSAAEREKLQKFVTGPNAPRVAGSLSVSSDTAAARNLANQA